MSPRETEADARIAIDGLLRQAGWDPLDKSMVATEIQLVYSHEDVDYWRDSLDHVLARAQGREIAL